MKWIKASDRLPEVADCYVCKIVKRNDGIISERVAYLDFRPVYEKFCSGLDEFESCAFWLDESEALKSQVLKDALEKIMICSIKTDTTVDVYYIAKEALTTYNTAPMIQANELPAKIYLSRKTGKLYRLTADENSIDLENPLPSVDLSKYKKVFNHGNLIYDSYELKPNP